MIAELVNLKRECDFRFRSKGGADVRIGGSAVAAAVLVTACGARPDPAAQASEAPCLTERAAPASAPSTTGMVLVQGGTFTQGAEPLRPEEGPPRRTRVGDFWIDRTEVTNDDFARFVRETGYVTLAERPLDPRAYPGLSADQRAPSSVVFHGGDPQAGPGLWWRVVPGANWRQPQGPGSSIAGKGHLPVVQVAWEDAMAYARWLGRDLPTEAEWEFAARGGIEGAAYVWGDRPLDAARPQANVWQGPFPAVDAGTDGYKARVAPVGCFPANGHGLHDMAGNVWEWTRDWYAPGLDPAAAENPAGPPERQALDPADPAQRKHVIKGGSFLCAENFCYRYRPPARQAGPADTGSDHVGFRTVLRIAG